VPRGRNHPATPDHLHGQHRHHLRLDPRLVQVRQGLRRTEHTTRTYAMFFAHGPRGVIHRRVCRVRSQARPSPHRPAAGPGGRARSEVGRREGQGHHERPHLDGRRRARRRARGRLEALRHRSVLVRV
ncbi:unnamed protein product, partial [Ectocarpus sp. 13 AM-2016]